MARFHIFKFNVEFQKKFTLQRNGLWGTKFLPCHELVPNQLLTGSDKSSTLLGIRLDLTCRMKRHSYEDL